MGESFGTRMSGWNPSYVTSMLCGAGQVGEPLCASISSSANFYFMRVWGRFHKVVYIRCGSRIQQVVNTQYPAVVMVFLNGAVERTHSNGSWVFTLALAKVIAPKRTMDSLPRSQGFFKGHPSSPRVHLNLRMEPAIPSPASCGHITCQPLAIHRSGLI